MGFEEGRARCCIVSGLVGREAALLGLDGVDDVVEKSDVESDGDEGPGARADEEGDSRREAVCRARSHDLEDQAEENDMLRLRQVQSR